MTPRVVGRCAADSLHYGAGSHRDAPRERGAALRSNLSACCQCGFPSEDCHLVPIAFAFSAWLQAHIRRSIGADFRDLIDDFERRAAEEETAARRRVHVVFERGLAVITGDHDGDAYRLKIVASLGRTRWRNLKADHSFRAFELGRRRARAPIELTVRRLRLLRKCVSRCRG